MRPGTNASLALAAAAAAILCVASICGAEDADVCQLPAEAGMCMAYIKLYFFNASSGRCELFVYGGCGGNGNRFNTQGECERACGSPMPV